MKNSLQRKYFSIIDGIIAGEKEGPLQPTPISCGTIIGGYNPVAVDTVAAQLMNFNIKMIPTIHNAYNLNKYPLFNSNYYHLEKNKNIHINKKFKLLSIQPSKGWLKTNFNTNQHYEQHTK